MVMVALLFRPWITIIENLKAVPRILADDIMVTASGYDHETKFHAAFDATNSYIADMGAT